MKRYLFILGITLVVRACTTNIKPEMTYDQLTTQYKYVRAENYLLKQHLAAMGEDTTKILYGEMLCIRKKPLTKG
jgi:hypothetical protein